MSASGKHYQSGTKPPGAVAVPTEFDGELKCYVILPESGVATGDLFGPVVVSSLLEELLHVEFYARRWNLMGYVQVTSDYVPKHLVDVFTVASKLLDEFRVNSLKVRHMTSQPLTRFDGVFTPIGGLAHPGLVVDLDASRETLKRIVASGNGGSFMPVDIWLSVIHWIWRYAFEPLTYDAGRRAWNNSTHETAIEAVQSSFFREHILVFWDRLLELYTEIDSGSVALTGGIDSLVAVILDFASYIGVDINARGLVTIKSTFYRW